MLIFDITQGYDKDIYNKSIQEMKNLEKSDDTVLASLILNISNKCNYKCIYCYANYGNYGRANELMSLQTLKKIISELKINGIKNIEVVELFGGEPTINENLSDIVSTIYKNFDVNHFLITTNGSASDELIKELIDYPVLFHVSIDGPEEINDSLRGKGSFAKAINFIKILKDNKIPYKLSTTYTHLHEQCNISYDDLYEFSKKIGSDIEVSTVIVDNNSNLKVESIVDEEYLNRELNRTIDVIKNNELAINLDPYIIRILKAFLLSIKSSGFCDDLNCSNSLNYDYDGSKYNCFKLWSDSRFKLEDFSTNEILNVCNDKNNFSQCSSCTFKYMCELCVADTILGNEEIPFINGICYKKKRYDLALDKVIETIENGDIVNIQKNFVNYIL